MGKTCQKLWRIQSSVINIWALPSESLLSPGNWQICIRHVRICIPNETKTKQWKFREGAGRVGFNRPKRVDEQFRRWIQQKQKQVGPALWPISKSVSSTMSGLCWKPANSLLPQLLSSFQTKWDLAPMYPGFPESNLHSNLANQFTERTFSPPFKAEMSPL